MRVLSLSKRPATKRLAGRFDRLRTRMARSYGCPAITSHLAVVL